MRFKSILSAAASVFYCTSVLAKTYENQEIVLDSATLGLTTYEDDELMVLKNAKVTLNDFTTIKLPEGISLSGNSVLTITAPSGDGTPYSIVINGKVSIDDESQFIFDGSSLSYNIVASDYDYSTFTFDINTGADGVFISKNSLMRIKLPKTTGIGIVADITFNPSIHIGGTYKAPNNSPLAILGNLEVLRSDSKVDGYFDDKLWRVDLGPDHIDENGVFTIQNDLSGNIHCQAFIGVYADIFKGTENVLIRSLGYQGYSVVSPITIDLGEGPLLGPQYVLNYILLPEGQDGFKFLNLNYLQYGNSALQQLGLIYFFDGDSKDVIATAENNVIEVKNLTSQKSISVIGDHNYNITSGYVQGGHDARNGYFSFHKYASEIGINLLPVSTENSDYTTTIDKGNGDFETDLVSHITTKDSDGKPTTITTTIPLHGPAPPAVTKTVDLGNEVTEYLVISYWTTTNEFGGLITTNSTATYSPPPVTVTATTASDYIESDWISFFITTDEKGDIVTSSTLFNATRDYNLPEAPHTSFGPAPPAVTKTVDLGNEVTEYLVISYWTTTNEFGGLITTNSTATYSPPPVTVTATTASDYIESDWISFFITTDEKGDIVTSSTLFNATRDYNLPEAPHTSFGPAPPAVTKTVDLGNEVTEYLVISYWTTTNEFGGLITTNSTATYSPPPVTVTATTASDYIESDWISFFITTDEKGDIVTSSTLFNATRDYNLLTVDLGNEVTEYLVISYWTTTNEFGGLITTNSTATYSPPPVTVTATTASDYIESDWISFFITTDEKGDIVTSSTLFNATRDYNLPEAPHTSFGPAPPAVTKTVDLGNEVTEYLVISYWTTTNEFGGLITTNSTATYSPPPVTVTATTASDYIESDWISFFITTDEKGDITVDLGNEVTEYLVISYWTTTNEFGGLITTNSTATYSPPPVTVTATTASDYIESDWISFFITTDEKGDIVTSSTLFNATRDYNLPEAPHTSFGPAPPAVTKTVDLGNEVTEYLVISYWTTTNEFGGLITTNSTATYSPPPVTVTATTASDYIESDWISFFITTDEKGDIVTSSTLFNATRDYNLPEAPRPTSFGPAPPAVTKTVDLGNEVTEYLVISYWTTTNEFGGLITTNSTATYSPPPVTVTATTASDYIESDWISFFITTDEKGDIVTSSTLFNATRDYNLPEAPHTSFGPAPPAVTKTVDLGNEVTEYLVISYWTTTNEFGGLITTNSTATYSPPPVTVTATTASDYIESDWISFFITTDEKGDIVTSSTLFNATRDYNLPEAPRPTSFGPAPPAVTKTVDLGNEVTEYLVISYWTTTNEFGGLITTNSTATYSPPPVTVTATTASDYIESDWISFFITTDEKGDIVTSSTLFNATRDYNLPEAPRPTSFGPAPPAVTKTVDLGNEVTEYLVISYWTTTNEFGGLITTNSTATYSPPPVTVTATTASDYIESDWISFFITTDEKGDIVTSSTLFNATRDYNLPEAPHTSFGPAPPAVTKTVDLGNEVTEYLVISYWTTTNEFGGLITTNSTATYSPPPVTVTATTASDYIESDWISFFITTDEKGDIVTSSTLFNATRDYNLPEAPRPTSFGPAPPAVTKTVDLGNEVTEYLVISYWTTTNEFGGLITTNSTATYSPPPVTVTATTASDYIESDWISFFITTDEKGDIVTSSTLFNATRDYIDAQAPYTSSSSYSKSKIEESDYTTTIDKNNGDFETDLVSHITTKDSDGKPTTITTTIPLKPSDAGEADYTTTIDKGNGDFETDLVSHITTKDSDGKPTTITTTIPLKPNLVSHITTKDSDGKPTTITTTIPLKPSDAGEAYTTTIDKGNGDFETDLVSHITTKDSDGKPTTITTTIPLKPSDAGEADYTTTIDKGNGDFETDLVSHITTKDSDGKPTTITTTIPLKPSDAGEADYTTTIDKGNGDFETDLVSHITTKDSDGKPTTITTTIPLKPSDAGEADYDDDRQGQR
ncbi:hypothetical protein J6895_01645 [Nakaseomyces glabratus]|nr:hypothetical protein J6895_01645 [Nakaseomyces glabratus]